MPASAQPTTAIQATACTFRMDDASAISGVEVTANVGGEAAVSGFTDGAGCVTLTIPVQVGVEDGSDLPSVFEAGQPYPNPTRDAFTIPFSAGVRQQVLFQVYDLQGRGVAPLVIAEVGPGSHRMEAHLGGTAPGVYIYRFQSDAGSLSGTLVKTGDGGSGGSPIARLAAGDGQPIAMASASSVLRVVRFEAAKTGFNTLVDDRDVEDGGQVDLMLVPIDTGGENSAPVITPIDNITLEEGANQAVSVLSSDSDGDAIELEAVITADVGGAPAPSGFFVFVDNGDGTGVLQLSPASGEAGAYTATVAAGDGELTTTESFAVIVTAVGANAPPVLEAIANTNVTEGESLEIAVAASDADGDAITLSAEVTGESGTAAFATFIDNGDGTGTLSLSPMAGDGGEYEAVITATDGEDSSTETFTVSVQAVGVNQPPALNPLTNVTLFEGETEAVNVVASDPDGDMLTLEVSATLSGGGNAPAGLFTFTDNGNGSGVLTLSPDAGSAGVYTVTATAADASAQVETSFTLTVQANTSGNNPPVVTPIADVSVEEGDNLQFSVFATDPDDDGLDLTASVVNAQGQTMGAAFFNFKDNFDNSGTIKFAPDPGDFGDYTATITATDGQLSATATFTVTVIAPGGNSAPVVADIGDKAVIEGNTLTVNVTASDVNGDPLTLTAGIVASGGGGVGPSFFDFTDNGSGAGTLTVTPGSGDAGTYTATITADDGIVTGEKTFIITVLEPGGEGGMVPLTDMGTQTYLGFSGGLYPNASNTMPAAHHTAGVNIANGIEPLDLNGNPSPSGKYVMVSVGMSNTTQEFCSQNNELPCDEWTFMGQALNDPAVNTSNLVMVNGARGGQSADTWESTTSDNYDRIINDKLIPQGLSAAQVQIAWVKVANRLPETSLPAANADAYRLEEQNAKIVRALRANFPNLKMVFLSSRIYAGYATTILNPEPYAYESGYGVKWAIEAQINQMSGGGEDDIAGNLDYTETAWIGWGAYLWADGLNPRSDGLFWERDDLESDGTHPSSPFGEEKVGAQLLDFFKNSPQTKCWFLENGVCE